MEDRFVTAQDLNSPARNAFEELVNKGVVEAPRLAELSGGAEDVGPAWQLFDYFQRGEYVSANMARWVMGNDDPHPWDALLGRKKTTYFDVADDLGLDGAAKWAFGLTGGILGDPIMPFKIGSLSKIGRLTQIVEGRTRDALKLTASTQGKNFYSMLKEMGEGGFRDQAKIIAKDIAKGKNALAREMEWALGAGVDVFKTGADLGEQGARGQRFALSYMGQEIPLLKAANEPLLRFAGKSATWMGERALPKWLKGVFSADVTIKPLIQEGHTVEDIAKLKYNATIDTQAANEIRRKTMDILRARSAGAMEKTEPFWKLVKKLPTDSHDAVAEFLETNNHLGLEKYLKSQGLNAEEAKDFWKHGRTAMDDLLDFEQKMGIAHGDPIMGEITYLPHVLTDYGKKILFGNTPPVLPKDFTRWASTHVSWKKPGAETGKKFRAFERVIQNEDTGEVTNELMSLYEINRRAKAGELVIGGRGWAEGEITDNIFSTDLPYVHATRYLRTARALTGKEYLDDLAGAFARAPGAGQEIPAGWVQPKNAFWKSSTLVDQIPDPMDFAKTRIVERNEKWWVPPEVAKMIDETFDGVINNDEINASLKWMKGITGLWKASSLAVWPAYHMRNAVGNAWNYFLSGAHKNWDNYADGLAISLEKKHYGTFDNFFDTTRLSSDGIKSLPADWKLVTPTGDIYTKDKLWQLMKEQGIVGGQFVAENESRVQAALRTTEKNWDKFKPWKMEFGGYQKGFEFGQRAIEDPFRIGLFMDGLRRGLSADMASLEVKKYFYDYFDLSKVERKLLTTVLPFYSWTRKNIPRQLEEMFKQPGKVSLMGKAARAFEERPWKERDDIEANPMFMPEWIKAGMPLHIRKNKVTGEHEYMLLNGWLPVADVAHIFDPSGLFTDLLNPILKEPYQQMRNFDSRYNREIVRFAGESSDFMGLGEYAGIPVSNRISHALRNVRLFSMFDRIMGKNDQTMQTRAYEEGKRQLFGGRLYPADIEKERTSALIRGSKEVSLARREVSRQVGLYQKGKTPRTAAANVQASLENLARLTAELEAMQKAPAEFLMGQKR